MPTKILIIDDDLAFLDSMKRMLRKHRNTYEVSTSNRPKRAKRIIQDQNIEILVTDIYMPDIDGMQLIKELHKIHPELRIIAISGGSARYSNSFLEMTKFLGAGCTLAKPFSEDELLAALQTVNERPTQQSS